MDESERSRADGVNDGRRVLVVDDNLLLRNAIGRELMPTCEVLLASGIAEARPLFGEPGDLLALVTDLQMDGPSDGLILLGLMRDHAPGTLRVLCTACEEDDRLMAARAGGLIQCFISKPWRRGAILGALSALATPADAARRVVSRPRQET